MNIKYLSLVVIFFAFAKVSFAQTSAFTTQDVIGTYTNDYRKALITNPEVTSLPVQWQLILSPDGTFEYHNSRQLKGQPEEHWYARGQWTFKGKIVSFTNSPQDIDDKYTINLNGSKARFFKKSPRNNSPKPQPTYIHFFKSDYAVTKSLKLHKTNE